MRRPSPLALARLRRGPVEVVPDPLEEPGALVEPAPRNQSTGPTSGATRARAPRPPALCGHCTCGFEGHGVQYGALVGWHTWAPEEPRGTKQWSEIRVSSCVQPSGEEAVALVEDGRGDTGEWAILPCATPSPDPVAHGLPFLCEGAAGHGGDHFALRGSVTWPVGGEAP